MHILTLSASHRRLEYAAWETTGREPLWSGVFPLYRDDQPYAQAVTSALGALRRNWTRSVTRRPPAAIGLRVLFGGPGFAGPTEATPAVLGRLAELVPQAPLHLPATLSVARGVPEVFPGTPLVLSFETAFFAKLPMREQCYGLDFDLIGAGELRRYGYHGLYHQAAVAALGRRLRSERGMMAPRILSLCLEPRPELVAVTDGSPLMVTSGATPLEGLPGDSPAGEADPAIVLTLAQAGGLGPEAIHHLLTHESGLSGLVGHATTLGEVVEGGDAESRRALGILQHRLLLSAGAGVATLDGLDGVIFSGRYAHSGDHLGPFLLERLGRLPGLSVRPPAWLIFPERRDRLVADETLAAMPLGERGHETVGPELCSSRMTRPPARHSPES
jgi:acetate kinase